MVHDQLAALNEARRKKRSHEQSSSFTRWEAATIIIIGFLGILTQCWIAALMAIALLPLSLALRVTLFWFRSGSYSLYLTRQHHDALNKMLSEELIQAAKYLTEQMKHEEKEWSALITLLTLARHEASTDE